MWSVCQQEAEKGFAQYKTTTKHIILVGSRYCSNLLLSKKFIFVFCSANDFRHKACQTKSRWNKSREISDEDRKKKEREKFGNYNIW